MRVGICYIPGPGMKKRVAETLQEENVQCFLPMMNKLRNWSDRKKYINMPVFPPICSYT